MPPVLEARVLDLDGELRVLDGLDTCVPEQLCEVTAACSRKGALAGSLGIETRCRRPEQAERAPTLIEIPDTRRHDAQLPELQIPTHFVWGDADAVFPFTDAEQWAEVVPGATLDLVPGSGHFIQEDATQDCVAAVLARAAENIE